MEIMQIEKRAGSVILVSNRDLDASVAAGVEASGMEVRWVPSIASALDLLRAGADHAVLVTELALPDGNWRDLVEQVKNLENSVPIVLVSSAISAELWWDALESGIQDVLHAPLTAPLLRQLVQANSTL